MNTPDYLKPLTEKYPVTAQFISRLPDVPVSTDRAETLAALEPVHRRVVEELGFEWKFLRRAQQVHGCAVAIVGDIGSNYPVEGVDGLVCSGVSDCLLGIYVADCAAVWLYDRVSHTRALLHSGKKGTEGNIVQAGITAMVKFFQANPADIIAVISPCIRPPEYEMDIPATIVQQLIAAGVPQDMITDSGLNTATDLKEFYSYRVEKGCTGRMLALFGGKHETH